MSYKFGYTLYKNCQPLAVDKCALSKKLENIKFCIYLWQIEISK
jgi:hypothetical protein